MNKAEDYKNRINTVINYVALNLDKPHTIDQLAEVAHFSKFHFHRLFTALTGETVQSMVNRLRLESAAATLIYRKSRSITQIAIDHGFSSSANFSKAFAKHFDCSPSAYRQANTRPSNNSKNGKDITPELFHYDRIELEVSIERHPETRLAYLRKTGQYIDMEIGAMHRDVWHWAKGQNCLSENPISVGITWSDSHIVDEENWFYDACVAVQPDIRGNGKIGIQTLHGGLVAQVEVVLTEGESHDLSAYWNWFVGCWFVASGFELRLCPSYEQYIESDQGFVVRLCLPLES